MSTRAYTESGTGMLTLTFAANVLLVAFFRFHMKHVDVMLSDKLMPLLLYILKYRTNENNYNAGDSYFALLSRIY